ncbi:DUF1329 domain-containing protein [Paraburkholderia elongata]|uniref:DUF1329 domain-containing protein n=1 Tax=Paraburkholderia elongata TaxID=2675747 RepID=A0A972SFM2_9BURK|nr:DUF1329 domain-containing protein [Paraburkholderia elongata]NPT53054.1 DUF1329 domain-containing protein [Paraburkholderia elongata]
MQHFFKGHVKSCFAALVATAFMGASVSALATELPAGTVISKANLDQIKNDTFMGHTISSLLTDRMVTEIRNFNRKIPLAARTELPNDPKWVEATQKYSGDVKYDAKTREITGYKAGLPFPTINESDPDAGEKIMWSYYYGSPSYPHDLFSDVAFMTFNSSGYESSQAWVFDRMRNRGRLGQSTTTADSGDWISKTIFVGVSPQDIKGTGTFTTRYDVPGKLEDQFVYIKSARRVRRLSGNAWMDPVAGFDFLDDDFYVYNARPSQYLHNKLIGKRWILAGADIKLDHDASKAGSPGEWPIIDSKEAPYWNAVTPMMPREVWVVECTPPGEHPYARKVVYVDTQLYAIYRGEIYDKKGEPWRSIDYYFGPLTGKKSGIKYVTPLVGTFVDFKARHATFFALPDPVADRDRTGSDYTPNALESYQ